MAKFCSICNAASADNAPVCVNCGAPFMDAAPVTEPVAAPKKNIFASIPVLNKLDDTKKASILKYAKFVLPVVALILVLIIIFGVVVPNAGYKGTINKFLNAIEKADAEKYIEYCNAYDFDNSYYDEDFVENYLEENIEELEYTYGENVKFSFKVDDCDKLTEDRLDDIQENYDNSQDCDDMEITKGYDIVGTLTVKGKDMDRDVENVSFVLIKEDGKWRIWSGFGTPDYF